MMRLFIAVIPDKKTLDALVSVQEQMKKQGVRGNYAPLENLHITLAFIGEYPSAKKVLDAMRTVPFSPFALSVCGIGRFGDLYYAKTDAPDGLLTYVKDLRAALDKAGVPYDKKKFTPHITLLRRASKPVPPDVSASSPPSDCGRVVLMRSDRTPSGMKYTALRCTS